MFRRQTVINQHHHAIGLIRHFGAHVVMGLAGAENPAAAMKVDHRRLWRLARRAEDPDVNAIHINILDEQALRPVARNRRQTSSQALRCSGKGQSALSGGECLDSSL